MNDFEASQLFSYLTTIEEIASKLENHVKAKTIEEIQQSNKFIISLLKNSLLNDWMIRTICFYLRDNITFNNQLDVQLLNSFLYCIKKRKAVDTELSMIIIDIYKKLNKFFLKNNYSSRWYIKSYRLLLLARTNCNKTTHKKIINHCLSLYDNIPSVIKPQYKGMLLNYIIYMLQKQYLDQESTTYKTFIQMFPQFKNMVNAQVVLNLLR